MTMRIIKEGQKPITEWQMECLRCGCIFVFDDRDVVVDDREGDEWVYCPECYKAICCDGREHWEKSIMHEDQLL